MTRPIYLVTLCALGLLLAVSPVFAQEPAPAADQPGVTSTDTMAEELNAQQARKVQEEQERMAKEVERQNEERMREWQRQNEERMREWQRRQQEQMMRDWQQ